MDITRFHNAIKGSLDDLLDELVLPEATALRTNIWTKMSNICNVREQRGAAYAVD